MIRTKAISKGLLLAALLFACTLPAKAQNERDSLKMAIELMEQHPDSVDLRLRKAAWNMQLGEWDRAKAEYDIVLRLSPDNLAGLYFRAYANEQLRRYSFARLDYEHLLRLVPGNFEARLGLALLNQKDKHFTEAMDQINLLVNEFPDSAIVFAARAGIEEERGMLELAEYDYSEALRKDPQNRDYRIARADLRTRLGRTDAARADLDELVRSGVPRPSLFEMYENLKK